MTSRRPSLQKEVAGYIDTLAQFKSRTLVSAEGRNINCPFLSRKAFSPDPYRDILDPHDKKENKRKSGE